MESYKLALIFALYITLCYAKVDAASDANSVTPEKPVNSTAHAEKHTHNTAVQSSFFPTDLSLKNGFGHALIYVGAAAFSLIIVGGLTLLLAPVFGYRVCSVLGNCEPVATGYSAAGTLQNPVQPQANAYPDYSGAYYPYVNYQKRSIEYIKPILETLARTYENSK